MIKFNDSLRMLYSLLMYKWWSNCNKINIIVFDEEKQLNQEKEKNEKKEITKFNDEDLKYSNDSIIDSNDDVESQQSRSVLLLSDSDEILQDLMKDDDSNFLIMKNKCMLWYLCSV